MNYSAIIVTFNKKDDLKIAIDSVLRQTIRPDEFIVIDNNSVDGTIEFLLEYKQKYPFLRIYRSKINLGLCKAINLGVNLAKNPVILNLDHDSALINDNWVDLAFQKLQNNRVALVWGTSNKGNVPNFKYAMFIGSAILFKKDTWNQVGGFPEDFFIYDNEADLTIRYYIAGYYPFFYEKIDVKHQWDFIDNKKGKFYLYYDTCNRLSIYWKYYPSYIALFLSLLHFVQVYTKYMRSVEYYPEPLRGLKQFLNTVYLNVYKKRKVLSLKHFFRICYQLRFPFAIYYVLKKIYR